MSKPSGGGKDGRILVIEDDSTSRHALARLLRGMGFIVTEAATVTEGLAGLDGQSSLILDLNLPDGDGTVVLKNVRAGKRPIKVAVYTGTDDRALLTAVNKQQPDGLFAKPVDLNALLEWKEQTA